MWRKPFGSGGKRVITFWWRCALRSSLMMSLMKSPGFAGAGAGADEFTAVASLAVPQIRTKRSKRTLKTERKAHFTLFGDYLKAMFSIVAKSSSVKSTDSDFKSSNMCCLLVVPVRGSMPISAEKRKMICAAVALVRVAMA